MTVFATLAQQQILPTLGWAGATALLLIPLTFWCMDFVRFRRLQKALFRGATTATMAPQELAPTLASFRFKSFRIRLVRVIAGTSAVAPTDFALEVVRALSVALERDLVSRPGSPAQPTGCQVVDDWRKALVNHQRLIKGADLREWGNELLDELSNLEQQLMNQQRILSPPLTSPKNGQNFTGHM